MPRRGLFIISEDPAVRHNLADLVRVGALGDVCVFDSTQAFVEQYDPEWCGCVLFDVRISAYEGLRLQKQQRQVRCKMGWIYIMVKESVLFAVEGASGDYDLKAFDEPQADENLLAHIREVLRRHERYCLHASERLRLQALYESTSWRERQVLERLAEGRTNKEIAADLGLSPRTVEIYRSRLQQKLQVDTAADLVRLWMTIAGDPGDQRRGGARA